MKHMGLRLAIITFFMHLFFLFSWIWIIGLLLMLFGRGSQLVTAIGMALVIFSVIISFTKTVALLVAMRNPKMMQEMYPENMDELFEQHNDEIFEQPEALPGRLCVERLRKELAEATTVEECLLAFEKECERPFDDELRLFECGTYSWNKGLFSLSLTRQFPDGGDEFYQVHMELLYEPDDENKKLFESVWDEHVKGDFFDYVRRSKAYHYAQVNKFTKLRIYIDSTE